MNISDHKIDFSEDDLKEVFALFSSSSEYELKQSYDPTSEHYFERILPLDEYELSQEKREFSIDALRSVFAFYTDTVIKLKKT
jgi:hypothetical protein